MSKVFGPESLRQAVSPTFIVFFCGLVGFAISEETKWNLDLLDKHMPYVFSHHQNLARSCIEDPDCPYKDLAHKSSSQCWGYEEGCKKRDSYSRTKVAHCRSKKFEDDFWIRADFGFVERVIKETKEIRVCNPDSISDSSLICSKHLTYCKAKNLYIDFRKHEPLQDRFKPDMFQRGMIGGYCSLNLDVLNQQNQHPYPLQSWYSELQNYTQLAFHPLKDRSNCDVIMDKPTVLMKLDSGINLYHHFCDFFNLYLSQHVNNSWFDTDIQIVMWDTSSLGYFDIFKEAWKAFTKHPIINLLDWRVKRVCFREAMFPLLPRMSGGLYYNTYIPSGCVGSSMFRAFSEHFLHRMKVLQDPPLPSESNSTKIRVTLLERGKPEDENIYRKVKNQPELIDVLKEFPDFDVKIVQYNWRQISLVEQLKITHNSDIFIGMHGSGLLHFLFLPDWAVAVELYNCGDERCYHDLARLRGLDYLTWKGAAPKAFDQGKHKRYGDNPKFWNYSFDPNDFRILVEKARELLLKDPRFIDRWKSVVKNVKSHNEL